MSEATLELEQAIGFSGGQPKALHLLPGGDRYIATVGACCIVNSQTDLHEQFFFSGHSDNISATALSPSGRLLASGQRGEADVIVWDVATLKPRWRFEEHEGSIAALAFSDDERLLLSVGTDDWIIVWDLATGAQVARSKQDPSHTLCAAWGGMVKDLKGRDTGLYQFATGGPKHITMWALNPVEGRLAGERISAPNLTRDYLCLAFASAIPGCPWLYAGTSSGDLVVVHVRTRALYHSTYVCGGGVISVACYPSPAGGAGGWIEVVAGGGDGTVAVYQHAASSLEHELFAAAASGAGASHAVGARSFLPHRRTRISGAVWTLTIPPLGVQLPGSGGRDGLGARGGYSAAAAAAAAPDGVVPLLAGTSAGTIYRLVPGAAPEEAMGRSRLAGALPGGADPEGLSAAAASAVIAIPIRQAHAAAVDPFLAAPTGPPAAHPGAIVAQGSVAALSRRGGGVGAAGTTVSGAGASAGPIAAGPGGGAAAAGAGPDRVAAASFVPGMPATIVATTGVCQVTGVGYGPGVSDRFVTCASDATVRVWDAADGSCISCVTAKNAGFPLCVAVSAGADFHVSGWQDGVVRAYLCDPVAVTKPRSAAAPQYHVPGRLGGGSNGTGGSFIGRMGALTLGGPGSAGVTVGGAAVSAAGMSAAGQDGRRELAAAGTPDDPALMWVIRDAHSPAAGGVTAVAISFNQRFVVTGGGDGGVRLWDIRTRALVSQFKEHSGPITDLILPVSGGDSHLVSVSRDRSILGWDLRTERRLSAHFQRLGGVSGAAVVAGDAPAAPPGSQQLVLATVASDQTLTFWDLRHPGEPLHSVPAAHGDGHEPTCIAMSTVRGIFATGGTDAAIRIWDARTGRPLGCSAPGGHSGTIRRCAFSPDGKQLVSVGSDGAILVWNIF